MRICKVQGCGKKYRSKGYCSMHYGRKRKGRTINPHCKQCKKQLTGEHRKWCSNWCYEKYKLHHNESYRLMKNKYHLDNYTRLPTFSMAGKGAKLSIFTNGVTKQMKELMPKIKDDILNDCIKHPRKYLDDVDEENDASS